MILQVIWNNKLQQSSLNVYDKDILEDYEVIISFFLKENVSNNFIQNFIGYEKFNLSYLEDDYFWLENISLTKNILAFFNVINLIDLKTQDLILIDKFCLKNNICINDLNNLGFQSPVKTISRDLSTKPKFMNYFLHIGDFSKKLLRTTFDFNNNSLCISINKRSLNPQQFFNHLNSNHDRIRIQESLAYEIENKTTLIDYFSQLSIYTKTNESIDILNENKIESLENLINLINHIANKKSFLSLISTIQLPLILFLSNPLLILETDVVELDLTFLDKKIPSDNLSIQNQLSINNAQYIPFLDRDLDDIEEQEIILSNNSDFNTNNIYIDNTIQNSVLSDVKNLFTPQILDKSLIIDLPIQPFLLSLSIKNSLIMIEKESPLIIDFLLFVNISNNSYELDKDKDINKELEDINIDFNEDNQNLLINLSINDNNEDIISLFANYPDFEKPLINFNYQGDNPLCIASFNENLELLTILIDYGWNPNYFDSNLNNALIIACSEGHKNIVRYLLTKNLQINFQNKKGYTALHFAVNDCNHRIVKLLLEAGADADLSDNDKNTPLSIAAFKGDINSTRILLQNKINIHAKNKKGYDARSIALIAKNHSVAKLIEDKIILEKHNYSLPPIIEKNL